MNKEEYDINLDHYIEITQREYNNLKQENKDLQQRIDKAIEYIKKEVRFINMSEYYELLEILGGKE